MFTRRGSQAPAAGFDLDPAELMREPRRFPLHISPRRDELIFVEASEADYRQASFLDPRGFPPEAILWQVRLSDITAVMDARMPRGPWRYLFHTGFCCSTLLSRCLEVSADLLVLREPMSLHCLEGEMAEAGTGRGREQWDNALILLMRLFARTWAADQRTLIKSDCAILLGPLARAFPGPCIVLTCSPRDFVASVLSCRTRQIWASTRLEQVVETMRLVDPALCVDLPFVPNPAIAAAALWWWQNRIFQAAAARTAAPTHFMRTEKFLANPEEQLLLALHALGLPEPVPGWRSRIRDLLRQDAKDPDSAASAATRARKLGAVRDQRGQAIDHAIRTVSDWVGMDLDLDWRACSPCRSTI